VVWGLGQLVTGALSDRTGRKPLIAGLAIAHAAHGGSEDLIVSVR
jgi:MFS family permease